MLLVRSAMSTDLLVAKYRYVNCIHIFIEIMLLKDIETNFPFLSIVQYGGNEYVGIINNQDNFVTSMYVYTMLRSDEEKKHFIDMGEVWWFESNRTIPISIFLPKEFDHFRHCLVTMNSKDVKVTTGPVVNIGNLSIKRIKRKSVQLMRKPKEK